jgi:hypothetical protein
MRVVSDVLQHFPDLTIEGFLGTPDWSGADRTQFNGPMRAAPSTKTDTPLPAKSTLKALRNAVTRPRSIWNAATCS